MDKRRPARDIAFMSKTPLSDWFPDATARRDPVRSARGAAPLYPRRFYRAAELSETLEGYALTLDGRPARTPAKRPLAVPSRAIAEAVAAEWNAQGEYLDPGAMPVTRLVNSALDGVAAMPDSVAADAARYGASDLVCYRAATPERLARRQAELWDPVLAWAQDVLGTRFVTTQGVVFVEQPAEALAAIGRVLAGVKSPLALAGLHAMTTLTGSVLLALAVARGRLSAEEAWTAAHVDEDDQAEIWGADDEALARRAARWGETQGAALLAVSG